MYLRYLCGQPHEVHDHFPFPVAGVLIRTLAVQVKIATSPSFNSTLELELGDVDQNIEEMANLCDELFDSDISTDSLTEPIMAFVRALHRAGLKEAFRTQIPSEIVLGCLRKAVIRLPDLHFISIVLADSLLNRLFLTLSDDDYKEGMAILDKLIDFCGPGDQPGRYRKMALRSALTASFFRFHTTWKPEHLERAINVIRTLLDGTSLEDPSRDLIIKIHSYFQQLRFDRSSARPNFENIVSSPLEPRSLFFDR